VRRTGHMIALIGLLLCCLACIPLGGFLIPHEESGTGSRGSSATVVRPAGTGEFQVSEPGPLPTALPTDILERVALLDEALVNLYARVSPSVVNVSVEKPGIFGKGRGGGSGWVWDREGHIVTNNHVIEEATEIRVTFANELEVKATLVGADPDSDLAVIKVDVDPGLLIPATLGDSSKVRVGQTVVAIGNPFGLERTMTAGIVSAIGRVSRQASGFSLPNLIQTDAPINPGNSGGPLLDVYGHVIGVTTLIVSGTGEFSGIGFAVPVNTVKRVVPSLIETGSYAHPWLGISGWSITPAISELLDLPVDYGVLVGEVVEGGPADRAGIRGSTEEREVPGFSQPLPVGGDLIVGIEDREVRSMDDLVTSLAEFNVEDRVRLTVVRGGETLEVEVVLGARPTSSK